MLAKRNFLFFCMIFVAISGFSQTASAIKPDLHSNNLTQINSNSIFFKQDFNKKIVPENFYVSRLGFFCRQEWKFESATKLPFKFRLGNVNYCDWLEGKKNAGLLPAMH